MAKLEINGEEDILALFDSLVDEVADGVLRAAAAAGAAVIEAEVITRAPRDKGVLANNIYRRYIPEEATETSQTFHVSWRKRSRERGQDPFYGVWVEYGHWYVPPKPKGTTWKRHRATHKAVFVPAHPFLRPAFAAKGQAALEEMKATLIDGVQRVLEAKK